MKGKGDNFYLNVFIKKLLMCKLGMLCYSIAVFLKRQTEAADKQK